MEISTLQITFFNILSCILKGTEFDWSICRNFAIKEWEGLYKLAQQHGVAAIVFEMVKTIPKEFAPPKGIVMRWLSYSLSIEKKMMTTEQIATKLADKLTEYNIPVVILKGPAYATYYTNPYHRESGDLDCFLMGKKEEGDKVVMEIGGTMEEVGYKHSILYYKGLVIENHRYLTSFNNTRLGIKTERLLQGCIKEGCQSIGNTKLLNPSADFNALFLIKHAQRHFIKEGICIRHLLDWAFFLKAESQNVNWNKVVPMMR